MAFDANGKFFMDEFDYKDICDAVNTIVFLTHKAATSSGWWDGYEWDSKGQAIKVALIGDEAFEAFGAIRTDSYDDHLPQYKGVLTELIDVLVRAGDTLGRYQDDDISINPGQILVDKMKYNAQRADHKPENRAKTGGKRF